MSSPDGRTVVSLAVIDGQLRWSVARDGARVVLPSRLGFTFRNAPALGDSLRVAGSARADVDETFTLPLGEVARVRDQHHELRVKVVETTANAREFWVVVRVFDDGLGFRYELPDQPHLKDFEIMDELTEFAMAEDMKAWWIPANIPVPDRQEMLYSSGHISKLDLVQTPLTLVGTQGLHVVIHEANLVDYAGMALQGRSESRTLRASLARWKDGSAVKGRTPFVTPWRTLQLADRAERPGPFGARAEAESPSRIADTRWIRPMKYDGIWWGMHVNTMTWSSGPLHGATTANARKYIDFAAANGLGRHAGRRVERRLGHQLDAAWRRLLVHQGVPRLRPARPSPRTHGERASALIVHNETGTFVENYERQLDSAFTLYERLGVTAIKTGYVNDTTNPGGHAHQSQYMVRHHRRVIETAAAHGIGVVMHEPIKDTGERRTWPNMLSREGARGQEYNAWGGEGGDPPEHETILFFTRMLSGPHRLHAGHLQPAHQPERDERAAHSDGRPPAHDAGQAAGPVRGAVLAGADGRRPDRELRGAAGLPVHPGRGRGLGHDARAARPHRRRRDRGTQGEGKGRVVRGRDHRRGGARPSTSRSTSCRKGAATSPRCTRTERGQTGGTIRCPLEHRPGDRSTGHAAPADRMATGGGQAIRIRPAR